MEKINEIIESLQKKVDELEKYIEHLENRIEVGVMSPTEYMKHGKYCLGVKDYPDGGLKTGHCIGIPTNTIETFENFKDVVKAFFFRGMRADKGLNLDFTSGIEVRDKTATAYSYDEGGYREIEWYGYGKEFVFHWNIVKKWKDEEAVFSTTDYNEFTDYLKSNKLRLHFDDDYQILGRIYNTENECVYLLHLDADEIEPEPVPEFQKTDNTDSDLPF